MYAMDTAVHFEHRTETRRSRWEIRRSQRHSLTPAVEPTPVAEQPAPDSPIHDFVD